MTRREQFDNAIHRLSPYVETLDRMLADFDDNDPESCDLLAHFLEGLAANAQDAANAAGDLEASLGFSEANKPPAKTHEVA